MNQTVDFDTNIKFSKGRVSAKWLGLGPPWCPMARMAPSWHTSYSPTEPFGALVRPVKPYETDWTLRGPMKPYGTPWNLVESYGIEWKPMKPHRMLWNLMGSDVTRWSSMEADGPWRNLMKPHEWQMLYINIWPTISEICLLTACQHIWNLFLLFSQKN